jgi:tRNA threonylcarbamoyladenosine biosynthesis protein TsaB
MSCVILHLETATKVCSVALSVDGNLVALKESASDAYIHGECLTLFIEEVLQVSNINIEQLSAVSISSGPGSYTGLRIGVSTAKGLCFGLQIPLIEIETLDALMQKGYKMNETANLLAVLDARRMEVYSLIQSSKGKILKPVSADILVENSYSEFEPLICFGDGTEKLKELWKKRAITFMDDINCSASDQVELAYSKFQKKDFQDLNNFTPKYLKEYQFGI